MINLLTHNILLFKSLQLCSSLFVILQVFLIMFIFSENEDTRLVVSKGIISSLNAVFLLTGWYDCSLISLSQQDCFHDSSLGRGTLKKPPLSRDIAPLIYHNARQTQISTRRENSKKWTLSLNKNRERRESWGKRKQCGLLGKDQTGIYIAAIIKFYHTVKHRSLQELRESKKEF